MADGEDLRVRCATYTHARRHPMVIGKIGDWTPPVQLTFPQLGVLGTTLLLLYLTWGLWATHLPVALIIIVLIGLPSAASWFFRRARIEGRSLLRAGFGWLVYLAVAAGRGRAGGRPHRSRSFSLDHGWVYVSAVRRLPDLETVPALEAPAPGAPGGQE